MMRVQRARAILVADQPFYGIVSLRLKLVDDLSCKDIWCDGVRLGFNPKFIRHLGDAELKGIIAKMALHSALGHTWRCQHRDLQTWNQACNFAVMAIVKACRYLLPGNFEHREEFDGWCAEAIYTALKDEQAKNSTPPEASAQPSQSEQDDGDSQGDSGDGAGDSGDGEAGDGEPGTGDADASGNPSGPDGENRSDQPGSSSPGGPTPDPLDDGSWRDHPVGEVRPLPEEEDAAVCESGMNTTAVQASMAQGTMPGSLSMALRQAAAKVNWKEILWDFAQRSQRPSDYSWSRPNPRFMTYGLYMPRLTGEEMPPMAVALDTSGSMHGMAQTLLGEVEAILSSCEPKQLDVFYADAAVQAHEVFEPGDSVTARAVPGGGGTDFRPVFDHIKKQGDDPSCLVYLTDMEGSFPLQDPGYPVLWVVPDPTGRLLAQPPRAPFGDVVVMPAFS